MKETYRKKPEMPGSTVLTAVRYSPPLTRAAYEELRELAAMAPAGEACEVTFLSGKTVLVARSLYSWGQDGHMEPDYTETEPGEYLAYSHGGGNLFSTTTEDLAEWYEKEES